MHASNSIQLMFANAMSQTSLNSNRLGLESGLGYLGNIPEMISKLSQPLPIPLSVTRRRFESNGKICS